MVVALIVLVVLGLLAFTDSAPSCPAPLFHAPADRDHERERAELRARA